MCDTQPAEPPCTNYECRICWWVYDPAEGDEIGQIPVGTPFVNLPPDWRCPSCDGGCDGFLAINR